MKKYAHLVLLFIGIAVSVVAQIRSFPGEPADALRMLRGAFGIGLLAFMLAPFLLLAVLGLIGQSWHWSRAAQQAWLLTNCLFTLASVLFYFPLIRDGSVGCMDSLALLVVPLVSWPVILGLWLLTWLVLRARYAN